MHCHICNTPTDSFEDEKKKILYHHCSSCEYIFKDPQYYLDLSVQKSRYDLHDNDVNSIGYQAYFNRFLSFLLPWLETKPSCALDFGCGRTSLLAELLGNDGIACDAYDPIYHPHTLEKNKKYDLIVSTEVFEHLHSPKEVFSSLVDMLNSGGYLAIQTQFHSNDVEAFKKWYYHQDPTHIVFFRAKTFEVLAQEFGCEYIVSNGVNMVLLRKV